MAYTKFVHSVFFAKFSAVSEIRDCERWDFSFERKSYEKLRQRAEDYLLLFLFAWQTNGKYLETCPSLGSRS